MLGYVCKYAPVEIFETMGTQTGRISPAVVNFNQADTLMHPNTCSFVKSVLEEVVQGDYEGVILTTCCDSVRRLCDVLSEQCPDKFIYMIDVPRKVNDFSAKMFRDNIRNMIQAYEDFSGKRFDRQEFGRLLERKAAAESLKLPPEQAGGPRIGLAGTRCSAGIRNLLENHHAQILFDMTCTGLERHFLTSQEVLEGASDGDQSRSDACSPSGTGSGDVSGSDAEGLHGTGAADLLTAYAWDLLNQVPCLRMVRASGRDQFMEGYQDRLDGLLCHTVKFCDMYAFEYARLREESPVPVLQVETDATAQSEGQIRTRVEAFLESLQKGAHTEVIRQRGAYGKDGARKGGEKMYVLGVDSGSTSTNAVILDEKKQIVAFDVVRTGAKSGESADRVLENVLKKAGIGKEDLAAIISTGYGRVSIPYADENVTEISCHGRGAHYFNPSVRTILDIGGQDSKAIRLSETGEVVDFVMNDKCAAGTGRFLEMMARTLEMDISQLGPESLKWKENIEITSMCTVFAESEVISLIAQNKEKADIAHGLHNAIAGKAYSLLRRVGLQETVMMTGGVAKNPGVVKAVEDRIGSKLYICEEPEIVGAIGAALYALERAGGE